MNLIKDALFERGFNILGTDKLKTGMTPVHKFDFFGRAIGEPVWRIAQWGSKHDLSKGNFRVENGVDVYSDNSKTFKCKMGSGAVSLEILASKDYERPRKRGEVWPHLLIAQDFFNDIHFLSELKHVKFQMEFHVDFLRSYMGQGEFDEALHGVQFVWFVTVQNWNKNSKDFGNYFWFGVPLYDSRYGIPKIVRQKDNGKNDSTHKYIYSIDATQYLSKDPLGAGNISFEIDVLDQIKSAFSEVKELGYLENTEFSDLSFGSMNTGLEMPGTYDLKVGIEKIAIDIE